MIRRRFLQFLSAISLFGFCCPALLAAQKRTAPKTVYELYLAMNEAMPVGISTPIAFAVTGEPYIEYAVGTYMTDRVEAEAKLCRWMWQSFLSNWHKSQTPRSDVLYWRIKPEIAFAPYDFDDIFSKRYRIYLRYLVSSKTPIYTTEQMVAMPHGTLKEMPFPFENGITTI